MSSSVQAGTYFHLPASPNQISAVYDGRAGIRRERASRARNVDEVSSDLISRLGRAAGFNVALVISIAPLTVLVFGFGVELDVGPMSNRSISALGQNQTYSPQKAMSALPPISTSIAFFVMSALGQKRAY